MQKFVQTDEYVEKTDFKSVTGKQLVGLLNL